VRRGLGSPVLSGDVDFGAVEARPPETEDTRLLVRFGDTTAALDGAVFSLSLSSPLLALGAVFFGAAFLGAGFCCGCERVVQARHLPPRPASSLPS
jgi:hypothetical protein